MLLFSYIFTMAENTIEKKPRKRKEQQPLTRFYNEDVMFELSIDEAGNWTDLKLDEVPMVNDARVIHLLSQGKLSINEILKKHHMGEYKNRLLD